MAQTGSTEIGFTPYHDAWKNSNVPQPEKAGQTHQKGAIVQLSGGYAITSGTGTLSTGYGIAISAGQDLDADGDADMPIWPFKQGEKIVATLNGVYLQTYNGTTAKVAQASGGIPTLTVEVSSGMKFRIVKPAPGWNVGDTNARVIAIPFDSFIEQGGGNE